MLILYNAKGVFFLICKIRNEEFRLSGLMTCELLCSNGAFSFQNFINEKAELQENDGLTLVKEMANDVSNMMKFKVDAVNVSISASV